MTSIMCKIYLYLEVCTLHTAECAPEQFTLHTAGQRLTTGLYTLYTIHNWTIHTANRPQNCRHSRLLTFALIDSLTEMLWLFWHRPYRLVVLNAEDYKYLKHAMLKFFLVLRNLNPCGADWETGFTDSRS